MEWTATSWKCADTYTGMMLTVETSGTAYLWRVSNGGGLVFGYGVTDTLELAQQAARAWADALSTTGLIALQGLSAKDGE